MNDLPHGTPTPVVVVDEPGVYTIDPGAYHADPVADGSLSSTEARRLLDCPARYRWARDHAEVHTESFDFGKAAHRLVLGAGDELALIEADDWRTKAAKETRDAARAAGVIPVLRRDMPTIVDMATALRLHPIAARLLDPASGMPEQGLFWRDDIHPDVWRRALVDFLPVPHGRRLVVPDYKTARSADAADFGRAAASFGYADQAAWYLDGIRALLDDDQAAFVFVVQERDAPYLVNVIELDAIAMTIGRERNRRAIDVFRRCRAVDEWPGYGPDVETASLPRWFEMRHDDELVAASQTGSF